MTQLADGDSLDVFASRATQAARNRAGELLFDFAFESLFRHGIFNADPHPGNYLFDDGRVTFIDFGCVKRLSPAYVATFKALARAMLERDRGRLEEICLGLGIVGIRSGSISKPSGASACRCTTFIFTIGRWRGHRNISRGPGG